MFTVREARESDARSMAELHVHAWREAYRGLLPAEHLASLSATERAGRYRLGERAPGEPLTLVALEADELLGFVTLGAARDGDRPEDGELLALYVGPALWGRGIGGELIAAARRRLDRDGFAEALLWVLQGNTAAIGFYQADGWRADGATRAETIGGASVTLERWRRPLP